jgi:hypothetical protein
MANTLADLLDGGGKTAKFENIGDSITGKIIAAETKQQKDFDTGAPMTWDDGNPRMQVVITIATSLHEDTDDDGARNVYVKGFGDQLNALRTAVRAGGGKDLSVGGTFTATYSADGPQPKRGLNAPKVFTYTYEPPSTTAALLGADTAPTTPAPAPATASAPAAAAADPSKDVATAKALLAAGLDDASILAAAPGLNPVVLAALRNAA